MAPVPFLEHAVMIPAPHTRMISTALGNPAGATGGSGTEAMQPAVSSMSPAPWAWFDPFISLGPLLKLPVGLRAVSPHCNEHK